MAKLLLKVNFQSHTLAKATNFFFFFSVEIDVLCHNLNSDNKISMTETNFAKLVSIMDKLVKGDFGEFNDINWKFVEKKEFIDTSFQKQLMITLVSYLRFFFTFSSTNFIFFKGLATSAVQKYTSAIMHYKGKNVYQLFHLVLEQLNGVVELPVTYFVEGTFPKLNEEEQMEVLTGLLHGKWCKHMKKSIDEEKIATIDSSKSSFFLHSSS